MSLRHINAGCPLQTRPPGFHQSVMYFSFVCGYDVINKLLVVETKKGLFAGEFINSRLFICFTRPQNRIWECRLIGTIGIMLCFQAKPGMLNIFDVTRSIYQFAI